MWLSNAKKAHWILYLPWLLWLISDPSECKAALRRTSLKPRRQPSSTTSKYRQNGGGVCLNQSSGDFVEHPDNCRLFYLCQENGQAVVAQCPPTMLFNPDSKLCDAPSNVRCRNGSNTSSPAGTSSTILATTIAFTTPPTVSPDTNEVAEATRYCAALPQQQEISRITFIGSSSSCQRYFICYYGQALLQECSANLHWNANIGKCDLPANADCRVQQNNDSSGSEGSGSGGTNTGGNGSGNGNAGSIHDPFINCPNYGQHIFPHLARCDLFIYCVKGHATLQQCPFYYSFDIVTKSCKWRTRAVCVRDLNINF